MSVTLVSGGGAPALSLLPFATSAPDSVRSENSSILVCNRRESLFMLCVLIGAQS